MKIVIATDPTSGKQTEFRYDNLDKPEAITIYRDKVYCGCYSVAVAEAGFSKMRSAGWSVVEESR